MVSSPCICVFFIKLHIILSSDYVFCRIKEEEKRLKEEERKKKEEEKKLKEEERKQKEEERRKKEEAKEEEKKKKEGMTEKEKAAFVNFFIAKKKQQPDATDKPKESEEIKFMPFPVSIFLCCDFNLVVRSYRSFNFSVLCIYFL